MKHLSALIIAVTLLFTFSSCKNKEPLHSTWSESVSQTEQSTLESKTETVTQTLPKADETITKPQTSQTQTQPQTQDETQPLTQKGAPYVTAPPVDTNVNTKYTRTGVIAFSDSPDNEYIKLVSEKYGVLASLLAAIFTIPYEGMENEADGNVVLRFDGSKDSSGKLIRTEDTLKTIYTIDAKGVCKRVSVDGSEKDDYNIAEKRLIILSVKQHIMPTFQSELY